MRRFAHYDYWSDTVRRSLLVDSKADVLIYGMGEKQILELAKALDENRLIEQLPTIKGICYMSKTLPEGKIKECPSYEIVKEDKKQFAELFAFNIMNKIRLSAKPWLSFTGTVM